jgi:hypothetical protein
MRILALLLLGTVAFAARWEIVHFHDEDKSSLTITALEFPSATRGVATGVLQVEGKSPKYVALVTSDGGTKWTTVQTKEPGLSLYFLSEADGWMVTPNGIWYTQEAGRSWTRILKRSGLTRVHFVTRDLGFAIGDRKTVLRTEDGGKTWKKVPEAEALSTNRDWTTFNGITFATPQVGIIVGRSQRPRRLEDFPIWMDPEARKRREWPAVSVMLQTDNGGKTWKENKVSLFGSMTRVSMLPDYKGLALLEFENYFEYASEVYSLDLQTGKSERIFRRKDFAVTDVVAVPKSTAFMAGFQPPGLLARAPVPGKVRIAMSSDLTIWKGTPVEYRAVATRVLLAVRDSEHAWAATDTGMILRLRN